MLSTAAVLLTSTNPPLLKEHI